MRSDRGLPAHSPLARSRTCKGILNNNLCIGRAFGRSRSEWRRNPDTKAYTYRVRPATEWIGCEAPELRIVPLDLWDRVQTRMGGANALNASRVHLERAVLAGLRTYYSDPARFAALTDQVRDALHRQAREAGKADPTKALRKLDQEIENLKTSLVTAAATPRALAVLEELLRQRDDEKVRLLARPQAAEIEARVGQVLANLPARVRRYLDDLDSLLAVQQISRGKEILAALDAEVVLRSDGDYPNAEVSGDLGRVFLLAATKGERVQTVGWGRAFLRKYAHSGSTSRCPGRGAFLPAPMLQA